jgi:hypothetical protein
LSSPLNFIGEVLEPAALAVKARFAKIPAESYLRCKKVATDCHAVLHGRILPFPEGYDWQDTAKAAGST